MDAQSLNAKSVFFKKGKQAFLFIHGFTSGTSSLLPTAELLAEKGWTISLPLLPGHGHTPEHLAQTTAKDWLEAALKAYDELAEQYPNPAVAGLSMGAALALYVAARRPVPAVVALSPALYLKNWRVHLIPIMKFVRPWQQAIGNDIKGKLFQEVSYERYKIKNIQDLLRVMKTARCELKNVTAPLLTMQSNEDHVVPTTCMDDLVKWAGSKIIKHHRLFNSYHVITMDNEYKLVADMMHEFLTGHIRSE